MARGASLYVSGWLGGLFLQAVVFFLPKQHLTTIISGSVACEGGLGALGRKSVPPWHSKTHKSPLLPSMDLPRSSTKNISLHSGRKSHRIGALLTL